MHIRDILSAHSPTCSFEFFPPKTEDGAAKLFTHIRALEALKPSFVSVTYGAGGTTRDLTHDIVVQLLQTSSLASIPHLTCVAHSRDEIAAILRRYAAAGVGNVLALRGDPPKDRPDYRRDGDAFQHGVDLVRFIREFGDADGHPDPRGFGIGVAGFPEGHPGTPNRLVEMDHLRAKVDAGADYIVTQLFFDNRDFYDFRERCALAGISVPIIAGIMPVTSLGGMRRMAEFALGVRFPAGLVRAVNRCDGSPGAVSRVGIHWATEQCRDLLDQQVSGLHFYTLNRADATLEIYRNLGLADSTQLRKTVPPILVDSKSA